MPGRVRDGLWCALAFVAAAAGCGGKPTAPHAGAPEPPARRIVSVSPSATEILFALGVGDRIVGVSTADTYPPEARRIVRVGDFGRPNLERLLRLKPDLVVYTELLKPGLEEEMKRRGLRVLQTRQGSFRDILEAVLSLGRATGTEERARALVAEYRARLKAVEERTAAVPAAQRPKVFIEVTPRPLYTAGGGSYLDEMVTKAGGVNIAHRFNRPFLKVSSEFVVQANPDVILVAYMQKRSRVAAEIAARIGWGQIAAVRTGRIITDIHPDLLCRPGPRLFDGLEALQRRLLGAEGDR